MRLQGIPASGIGLLIHGPSVTSDRRYNVLHVTPMPSRNIPVNLLHSAGLSGGMQQAYTVASPLVLTQQNAPNHGGLMH